MPSRSLESSTSAFINSSLACLLLCVTGSSFALGIFTVPVEDGANPPHVLDGIWQTSMGLLHFASSPFMILSGIYLDSGVPYINGHPTPSLTKSKTNRVRVLSFSCLLAFACLYIAGIGAAKSAKLPIFFGVGMQAVPLGVAFLLCLELLLAWNPDRPGLAVGCGQTAFGLGTIICTEIFNYFIRISALPQSIQNAALLLALGSLLPSILMRWPCEEETQKTEDYDDELELLLMPSAQAEKIPVNKLLFSSTFCLYLLVVFTSGVSYMFNPYYFKLGLLFNRRMDLLVLLLQVTNFISVVAGLFGAWITDFLSFGNGFWSLGSKNLMMGFLLIQVVMFLGMIHISNNMYFWAFMLVKTLLKLIMASHAACSALLAKDLFGKKNSAITFGIGAGLALGWGEGVSAWLMAWVESTAGTIRGPESYNKFYWIAALWSFLGWLAVVTVRKFKFQESREER